MEHYLSKVEKLNGDREPPFPFFKFSFSCLRVCVCVFTYFIYFILVFIFNLTYVLFEFIKFIIYFIVIFVFIHVLEKMRNQNAENSEKDNSITKQKIREKREANEDKTKL